MMDVAAHLDAQRIAVGEVEALAALAVRASTMPTGAAPTRSTSSASPAGWA
jgi:hypothetical protein